MVLSSVFDPFVQHNPFAVSARIALDHALPAAFLNDLFEQHAQAQYCRTLTFTTVVETMSAVVFRQARSVREAYQRTLKDAGVLLTALYSKLAGVELQTMQVLVRQAAVRLRSVLAALAPAAPWVEGFRVKILDGNSLAGTDHRLAPLLDTNAGRRFFSANTATTPSTTCWVPWARRARATRGSSPSSASVCISAKARAWWLGASPSSCSSPRKTVTHTCT